MSVCRACSQITPHTRQLLLHPNIDSLRTSARTCPLCRMICDRLERNNNVTNAEKYSIRVEYTFQLVNDTSVTVSMNGHHAAEDTKTHQLVFSCGPLKRKDQFSKTKVTNADVSWLNVETEESSPAAEVISGRPLAKNPNNVVTFSLIKTWISACVDGHKKCQLGYTYEELQNAGPASGEGARLRAKYSEGNAELPTRLIDVQAFEEDIRVVESASVGGRGCYLALSHVWGTAKHFKTEHATYNKHLTRIRIGDLPKTFRDAVFATRHLGVRFLWIDSLCIIQDSLADWAQESSRMASVYTNAYITLSAAAATNTDNGLFFPRPSPECSVSFTYTSPSGSRGTWTIHNQTPRFNELVRHTMLASRAWTLQERQLARRMLHFTKHQIIFECNECWQYESQQPSDKPGEERLSIQMLYWLLVSAREQNNIAWNEFVPIIVARTWFRMVENYTTRNLTFESDKLPALEGLARYVADLTRDRYIFGLWKSSLDHGLLWRTAPYFMTNERRGKVANRAPTWSWAGVDGRVYFAFVGEKPLEIGQDRLIDIADITADGMLVLGGRTVSLRRGKWQMGDNLESMYFAKIFDYMALVEKKPPLVDYEWVRSEDRKWVGWIAMDVGIKFEDDETQQQEVEALLVRQETLKDKEVGFYTKSEPVKKICLVLLLAKVAEENVYQRIGMGQIFLCEEVEEAEKRKICIV